MKTFFISLFYIIIHSRYDTYSFYSYQIFQKIPSSDTSEIFQNLAIFFSRSKSHPSKKKKKFPIVFTFVLANLDTNDRNKNPPLYPRYSKKKKKWKKKYHSKKRCKKNKESLLLCFELLFHNPLKNDILAAQRSTRSTRTEIFPSIVIPHETVGTDASCYARLRSLARRGTILDFNNMCRVNTRDESNSWCANTAKAPKERKVERRVFNRLPCLETKV